MKKNILFVMPRFIQGGVEQSLIQALTFINADKYDITIFIRRKNEATKISMIPQNVNVIINEDTGYFKSVKAILLMIFIKISKILHLNKISFLFQVKLNNCIDKQKVILPFKKYFKNKHYHVVISYTIDICTLMLTYIKADKKICFLHTDHFDFSNDIKNVLFSDIIDKIIACGPGVEKKFKSVFPLHADKTKLICNYINYDNICQKASEKLDDVIISKCKDKLVICTCSRLSSEKRIDLAVQAAALLNERNLNFIWIVVGEGVEREKLQNLIKSKNLDNTFLLIGNKDNPFPYYKLCDIYVQTSNYEAHPLSIMEAFLLGKAIVSTKTTGANAILEDGKKGILTSINAEDIAEGIMRLINDKELKTSLENQYCSVDDRKARNTYIKEWEALLA